MMEEQCNNNMEQHPMTCTGSIILHISHNCHTTSFSALYIVRCVSYMATVKLGDAGGWELPLGALNNGRSSRKYHHKETLHNTNDLHLLSGIFFHVEMKGRISFGHYIDSLHTTLI